MVCLTGLSVLCRDFPHVSFAFCKIALTLARVCVRDMNPFLTDLGSTKVFEVNTSNYNAETDKQHKH